jgi:hypothetical protein
MCDYQRSAVYSWEQEYIAPKDKSSVDISIAPNIVKYIWEGEHLLYPPKVRLLATQSKKGGQANRSSIWLPPKSPTWVIIHEVAHSMNDSNDITDSLENDSHGPNYVGIYIKLLSKYLNISLPLMMYTLKRADIDFNLSARPLFLK